MNCIFVFIGLVISLFDILEIGDSHLVAGDGASHTRVTFRVLVFRPFIEEIIVGKIKSSNSEGKLQDRNISAFNVKISISIKIQV